MLGPRAWSEARALAVEVVVLPALAALEAGASVEAALDEGFATVAAEPAAARCDAGLPAANASK